MEEPRRRTLVRSVEQTELINNLVELEVGAQKTLSSRMVLRVLPLVVDTLIRSGNKQLAVTAFRFGFYSWATTFHQLPFPMPATEKANKREIFAGVEGHPAEFVAQAAMTAAGITDESAPGVMGVANVLQDCMRAIREAEGRRAGYSFLESVELDLEALPRIGYRALARRPLWPLDVRDHDSQAVNLPHWARRPLDEMSKSKPGAIHRWWPLFDWYRAILPDRRAGDATSAFGRDIDFAITSVPDEIWDLPSDGAIAYVSQVIRDMSPKAIRSGLEQLDPDPSMPEWVEQDVRGALNVADSSIPEQEIAPVLVEERDGRISKVHNTAAPMRVEDGIFERWRGPVAAHIRDELENDFAIGTNHVRVRTRLLELYAVVDLPLPELKDRQFELGYSIQRFRSLVVAYRTAGDDMPQISSATLADLEHLAGSLETGVGKLEDWQAFNAEANEMPLEALPEPQEVGVALEAVAEKMEEAPSFFDPELPRSLRILGEAMKDPAGAGKAVVFGAVRSLENLVIGASKRLVRILAKALDNAETVLVSKATIVITGVVTTGGAALLAGLSPGTQAWLETVMRLVHKLGTGG